eukprot:6744234-Lingulodinium_polyedra.AAC.1
MRGAPGSRPGRAPRGRMAVRAASFPRTRYGMLIQAWARQYGRLLRVRSDSEGEYEARANKERAGG